MSFDTLPTELYDSIFRHVPSPELQQTLLSVTRAIPYASVPLYHLFRSIHLKRAEQAILLYSRLRLRHESDPDADPDKALAAAATFEQTVGWVKEFSVETWSVDAEIVINLVRILPNLRSLNIWIGPNNFAPEHLERLLSKPMESLEYLALRFRPYVEKATYYQFLKGAYFDSTLTALSLWPASGLPILSIVQDPHNQEKAQRQGFAQPLVFFRLDLPNLLNSPVISSSLQFLRLRIPFRPVVRSLCPTGSTVYDAHRSVKLPKLEFLDLSTCGILDAEIDTILTRFTTLKHIILDGCSVLRGDLREGEGNALGKRCALIGVRRAKDREKELKAWLESRVISDTMGSDGAPALDQGPNLAERQPKRGRRGLATATISFRTPDRVVLPPKSAAFHTKTHTTQSAKKIRVLPSLPTLSSLSVTLSSAIKPERYSALRAEFEEGWREGIAQLAVTRGRLRTFAGNGVRVMRICPTGVPTEDIESDSLAEGLYGLEDVDQQDPDAFGMSDEAGGFAGLAPPILCFAGPGRNDAHEINCGHSIGWEAMRDDI